VTAGTAAEQNVNATVTADMAGRYAVALFDLAKAQNAQNAVEADFAVLAQLLAESDAVRAVVESPLLQRRARAKAVDTLLEALASGGHKVHTLTRNFLGVVAGNGRLYALGRMISAYSRLLAAERGEVTAEVVSARALDQSQMDALKAKLSAIAGRDVAIDARVDAGLLGGLTVQIGSRMIDASLKTKLNNLQTAMKEAQ
jgi:F-type H+-transporting ATPase subunit delta